MPGFSGSSLTAFLTAFLLELLFIATTTLHVYHHLGYLQLLCKPLVKISHSCSTVVPNKEFKIIVIYTFKPPILLPISLAFFTHFSRISLSFTMASSQPDSPSDSEPEAIPESPPTLRFLHFCRDFDNSIYFLFGTSAVLLAWWW
jgi:hypothetical protein